jgi:hypothetical protein
MGCTSVQNHGCQIRALQLYKLRNAIATTTKTVLAQELLETSAGRTWPNEQDGIRVEFPRHLTFAAYD